MKVLQGTVGNRSYPPDTGGYQRTHGLTVSFPNHGDSVLRYCCTGPLATYYADGRLVDRRVQVAPGIVEERHYSLLHDVPKATALLGYPSFLWPVVFEMWPGSALLKRVAEHDLIVVDNPYMASFVAENADVPTVYSSHNVEYQKYLSSNDGPFTDYFGRYLRRVEEHAAAVVDAVVCTTEPDREVFAEHARSTMVVPNGVSAGKITSGVEPTDRGDFGIPAEATVTVFLGSNYGPNVEAAEWLAENWATLDDGHHLIVLGSVGDAVDSSAGNVHTTGYVKDLQAALAMADVAVNPTVMGGGSNVKLVEYFAVGLPVVSTPFGAVGFDVTDEEHLLVAERDEFFEELRRLFEDEQLRDRLGANCRELAASRYTWETLSDQFWEKLRKTLSFPSHSS